MDELARNLFRKAWDSSDSGLVNDAIKKIDRALVHSPKSSVLWVTKAQFLADLGNVDDAIISARKSVSLGPRNVHAYVLLGKIYACDDAHEAAVAHFEKAIELEDDFGTRTMLAKSLLHVDVIEAKRNAEVALKMNPDWEDAKIVLRKARLAVRRPGSNKIRNLRDDDEG